MNDLSENDFEFFRNLIFRLAGINLTEKKRDLVCGRIGSHLHKNGITSFSTYRKLLEESGDGNLKLQEFVNLLTTNKTYFFRESRHFSYLLNQILCNLKDDRNCKLKIWCCASSTGEEPYTLSMLLRHHLPTDMQYNIWATDVDTEVISRAKKGVYAISQLSEIPEPYQSLYTQVGVGNVIQWFRIQNEIYKNIEFDVHNLMDQSEIEQKFDIIFCRNVLIYFDAHTVSNLMVKLHRALKPEGVLFIGHSEAITNSKHLFKSLAPSVYKKI